ncbi:glycosyl-4,4'-diaponeurosporenoate acyltransferase CrtO family protein [Nocardiopsis metallicus]|uniref:Glycosyl-4,4'-diaponeurosporenoate acyltransferase n=1 Tax=Nocardiopsis metallicus TaxID=179819 RepID=A0A840W3T5_9ACTN|nr:hypothetical protein [Nocardiopsis metallicus]MBB5489963.1 hypothetical protein [Nocardiopsis metallicus]
MGSASRARSVIGVLAVTALASAVIVVVWLLIGPGGFAFAWVTHFVLMAWVSVVLDARPGPLEHPWFRVRSWEPGCYRALGAGLFGWVLESTGWNRVVRRDRAFDGTRAGLLGLDQLTRSSETGHLMCATVTVIVAVAALWAGAWGGALWLVALGVVLHVYPVMLQRSLRSRIQALNSC